MSEISSPRRGDIISVRFDPTEGSEQAGLRPALVISPDFINERAPVILVAPLTTRKTERIYPFETLIEAQEGGITQRSKVMLLHVCGIDKSRIAGTYGRLSEDTMKRVDESLCVAVGLTAL